MEESTIKEKVAAAIGKVLEEGIAKHETTQQLAERIVASMSILVQTFQPGPTGQFPDGKIDQTDEGQIKILVSSNDTLVRLDFGKPIAWFSMPKAEALTFAFAVLEKCGVKIEHQVHDGKTN